MTAWVLIAPGCFLALTGLVALTHWLAGRGDGRPPFAGPNRYARPPEVVAERHARALDRNRDHAHAALDRITETIEAGETP